MQATFLRSLNLRYAPAAAILAGLAVASCAPMYSSPQPVAASNPNVTYTYQTDDELIQANRNAMAYCNRYQSVPQTVSITGASSTDSSTTESSSTASPVGSKTVVFECVPTTSPAYTSTASTNLTHSYRTDQELLAASRNAQAYCMNNGSQQTVSSITTNVDGTRTVTFRCVP